LNVGNIDASVILITLHEKHDLVREQML